MDASLFTPFEISSEPLDQLSNEGIERILAEAKLSADSNENFPFDSFGICSEPQASAQQLMSNEEFEMILRLEEAKIFAESDTINQPDSSLSNNFGVSFESQQSASQLSEKVLCAEKTTVSTESKKINESDPLSDIFGTNFEPQQSTPRLSNEEFQMILFLEGAETSAESNKINQYDSSLSNTFGMGFESQISAPQLSDEDFEKILCMEKAKISAESNKMNQSEYSLSDIFGITSEPQPSSQHFSNGEFKMIVAESDKMNQRDCSLSSNFGVSFESQQSATQLTGNVLCEEKAEVSAESNKINQTDCSLSDNFGRIFEPHGQLSDEEFDKIFGLEGAKVSAESTTQMIRSVSDQDMTDWTWLSEKQQKKDDMLLGHSFHQAPDSLLQDSIISPDSGFCDEGSAASDSSSSTPPIYSQICEVKDRKDQCSQQNECSRTSVPKSSRYVFKVNWGLWKNRNYEIVKSIKPTSMIPKSVVSKPKVRILQGVRNVRKQKVFKCSKCEFSSYFKDVLDQHIYRTHIQPNQVRKQEISNERVKFTCEQCDFENTDVALMANHKSVAHSIRSFQCAICKMESMSKLEYVAHMDKHPTHPSSPSRSLQCNMGNRSAEGNHQRKDVAKLNGNEKPPHSLIASRASIINRKFTCTDCSFSTTDIKIFLNHIFVIHKYRWYKCPICRVCTTSPNASMEHFRKNPSHIIGYGEKKSQNKMNQPRREKKHRYKSDENLIIETKNEGNKEKIVITPKPHCFKKENEREKKFYCEICELKTYSYRKLMLHRNKVHNLVMRCPGCSFNSNSISEFIQHFMDSPTHMTKYLRCNFCDFGTYDEVALTSHKVRKHSKRK